MLPEIESRSLRWDGLPVPSPVLAQAILDTGSQRTTLRARILRQLGCPEQSRVHVHTSMGAGFAASYVAALAFPSGSLASLPRLIVAAAELPPSLAGFDGVIGRDILNRWETFYSGLRQRLTIRDHRSFWGWLFS
jgi:hypothetical protein